jgi:hypothetical protein
MKMKAPYHIRLSGATGPGTVTYSVEQGALREANQFCASQ